MRRRTEPRGGDDASSADPGDVVAAAPLQVSAPDIFVKVRAPRRELRPAPLRRGRHAVKDARRAAARANHPCQGTSRMYLVDGEGEYEETRIATRRRFEAVPGIDDGPGPGESVAG